MTKTDHLARAKDYIARGEDYYRKAAQEIVAAMEADPTLSYRKVGEQLGHDRTWVARLVKWSTSVSPAHGPFGGPDARNQKDASAARKVARENPKALVDAITAAPAKAQRKIADELVRSSSTERSLRAAVAPPKRKPREQKAIEQRARAERQIPAKLAREKPKGARRRHQGQRPTAPDRRLRRPDPRRPQPLPSLRAGRGRAGLRRRQRRRPVGADDLAQRQAAQHDRFAAGDWGG